MPALEVAEVSWDSKDRASVDVIVAGQRVETSKAGEPLLLLTLEITTGPNAGKHVWYRGGLDPSSWERMGVDGSKFGTRQTLDSAFNFRGSVLDLRAADFTGMKLRAYLGRKIDGEKSYLNVKGLHAIRADRLPDEVWARLAVAHGLQARSVEPGQAGQAGAYPPAPDSDLPF